MLLWRRRKTTKDISPCNSTTPKPRPIFQPTHITESENNGDDEEDSEFARCMHATSEVAAAAAAASSHRRKSFSGYPSMSTGSLRSILPKTPSPICSDDGSLTHDHDSSSSSVSDVFYSEVATEFSSQSICSKSDTSKLSSKFCGKLVPENVAYHAETETIRKHMDLKSCMAASSVYESTFETEQEDNCTGVHPDGVKTDHSSRDHNVCDNESPTDSRHKLMTRPKPYQAFLDEVNKQEIEAQIDKRIKAKQMKLMNGLRRKEAAISEWELKQTTKAMQVMRKLEDKLERRRAETLKSTEKKINGIKQVANEKKARARRIAEFKESGNTRTDGKTSGIKYSFRKLCC